MLSDHLSPSIQPQSFLEWTHTSTEQPLAKFYAILLEEHLQIGTNIMFLDIIHHPVFI
jgi:hypothetical protein